MSKIDNSIINNIKLLGLDMIREAGSGDTGLVLGAAPVFYSLYMNFLRFNPNDANYINRDRVIVNNRLLPLMYATNHLFNKDISIDCLKEYKKLSSVTSGYAKINTPGVEMGSITNGDVIATSLGVALGERYLESLIKIEDEKCKLLNFKTICICTEEDLMNGLSYEAMSFASIQNLRNLVFIVLKSDIARDSSVKETYNEDLIDRFANLNFDLEEVNGNNLSSLEGALEDAMLSKRTSVVIVKMTYGKDSTRENSNKKYNRPLKDEEMATLREKYGFSEPFEVKKESRDEIKKSLEKRLNKDLSKWQSIRSEALQDLKLKEIIKLLETGELTINFNPENLKVNENYEEELCVSNNKIFNLFTKKSPFILSGSNDNFYYTLSSITTSDIMSKSNPTGRNILFGGRTMAMGFIAAGLSSLGLKIFISSPLTDASILNPAIKLCAMNNLRVNFIFTKDTFLNTYEDMGNNAIAELNSLRLIPDLINFRPADIDEVIGVYDIIKNYNRPTTITIGGEKVKKMRGTNYKYVIAGGYRVKKERDMLNAIIIATGSEVNLALKIAEELEPYGIDFRVISMPCTETYDMQKEKYQSMLLPKGVKTFVIEFGSTGYWNKYATSDEYILGVNKFGMSGTRAELLSYYNLTKDAIKAKIVELLKK